MDTRIVISYAREDRAIVEDLAGTLRAWGIDAWTDAGAHSGSRWWDEIVGRIAACDVLLVVLSPAALASHACTLERRYAMALNKVVLPVLVAPVSMQALPPDLATIHFFDLTTRDVAAAGRLFKAVQQLPPPGPLPHPLPAPPPPPLSYLSDLAQQINALVPDLDLQHRIVTALTTGLRSQDAEERATATDLMRKFLDHPHRLPDPAQRAGDALARAPGATPPASGPYPAAPHPPVKRSRVTTALAWIGGVTVVLFGLGIWGVLANPSVQVVPAGTVSQRVFDDLAAKGEFPLSVSCGSLEAEVGATTYCDTPGLTPPGRTVRVTAVEGGIIAGWVYE